jgi:integrase
VSHECFAVDRQCFERATPSAPLLQRMLGHEQLNTVRIYATIAESDLQEAQKKASPADNWKL